MSVKLPEFVKVGALTYKVEETDRLELGTNYLGEILYDTLEIRVRPGAEQRERQTLLHEIIHAMLTNIGEKEHDERVVEGLAHMLLEVIQDNPDLIDSLRA